MDNQTDKIRAFVERERFTIRATADDGERGTLACIRLQVAWDDFWKELQATSPSTA
jgi:hypothetical protein